MATPTYQTTASTAPSLTGRIYKKTRPRGLAGWKPQKKTLALLARIQATLDEYAEHLPLTARQIFYRLVGAHGYPKTEEGYSRLLETLNRARRSGRIPFWKIRDDGSTEVTAAGFDGKADFWDTVREAATRYHRDGREGQRVAVEVWCESAGMVPQLARVAHPYGAAVYSSGGFDSVTFKHDAAQRCVYRDRPTVVLHIGDLDASGCSIADSVSSDVSTFVDDLESEHTIQFERVAVTREQAEAHQLPSAPPKKTDNRGAWRDESTVQAEALSPEQLRDILDAAMQEWTDAATLEAVREMELGDRAVLLEQVDQLSATEGAE